MQNKKVLLFGLDKALKSAIAIEIKSMLDSLGHEVLLLPKPNLFKTLTDWQNVSYDWGIYFHEESKAPVDYQEWIMLFKTLRHPPFLASVFDKDLPDNIRKEFAFEFSFTKNISAPDIIKTIGLKENTKIASDHYLVEGDLNLSQLSSKLFSNSDSGVVTNAFLEDPANASSWNDFSSKDDFKLFNNPEEPLFSPSEESNSLESPIDNELKQLNSPSDFSLDLDSKTVIEKKPETEEEFDLNLDIADLNSKLSLNEVSPSILHKETQLDGAPNIEGTQIHKKIQNEKEPVVFGSEKRFIEESATDSDDIKTIKRYAALKEREAREKQASLVTLRKEYDKLFEKLKKSDEERRRLQLKADELEVQLRTINDKKDEVVHQWTRQENQFQERIKELQIRVDSAQYQASKAERKLDDFRERVRNDIQKIRSRERELANRLELQKRDAEALLSTKDERLLQQKREIDKLQFEAESLRERLFEESERSDERVKRLNRVIQSLKLAQGLLSGIDDALPETSNSENKKGDKGEAA